MDEETLDLSGLKCPLPALMARKRLSALAPGAVLLVMTTDPLAVVDIPHMCSEDGHALENVSKDGSASRFRIRRKP